MERNGVAIAVALHVLVIGLLSVQWTAGDRRFDNPPMEVDLIAETAATSTAPEISELPPAARLGEEYATDIPAPEPVPTPPLPEPVAAPTPAPSPRQVTRPKPAPPKKQQPAQKAQPKPSPKATPKPKDKPTRPTGRLDGIAEGLSRSQPKQSSSKGAPAAATAAEVKRSIDVSIKAAVGPRWNSCRVSGIDVDQLKTVVKFRLTRSGALAGFTSVSTTGENDSNKFQVKRHQECAKRAVELGAPFDLPAENYDFWQNYTLDFIKR
jgi:outer membrane biosynthesis protein TonB